MSDSFNISIETRDLQSNRIIHLSTTTNITEFNDDLGSLEATAESLGLQALEYNNRMYFANANFSSGEADVPPDNLREVKIASFIKQNKTNQDGTVTTVVNAFAEWAVYSKSDGSEKIYGYYREFPIFFDNNYGYDSFGEMVEQFVALVGVSPEDMPLHPMSYSDSIPSRQWEDGKPIQREWEFILNDPVSMLVWYNDESGKLKKRLHRFGKYVENGYKHRGRAWK